MAVTLLLEIAGVALALWWYRRVGLDDPLHRAEFQHTGRLPRATTPPLGGSC